MPPAGRSQGFSAEQAALVSAVREQWQRMALATGPADRGAAEAGVRLAYEQSGLTPPDTVIWLESPLAASYAIAMMLLLRLDRNTAKNREAAKKQHPERGRKKQIAERKWLAERRRWAEQTGDPLWERVWDQINPEKLGYVGKDISW